VKIVDINNSYLVKSACHTSQAISVRMNRHVMPPTFVIVSDCS